METSQRWRDIDGVHLPRGESSDEAEQP